MRPSLLTLVWFAMPCGPILTMTDGWTCWWQGNGCRLLSLKTPVVNLRGLIQGLKIGKGWWSSLLSGDFDNDGDMDYVAGNLGVNSLSRASETRPVSMYAKDFNNDGYFDAIPTVFYEALDNTYKEFPYNTRDDMGKQIIQVRQRFQEYGKFAESGLSDILKPEELKDALHVSATWMRSSYVENQGNGKFMIHELPIQAQFAPIFGMIADDFDQDGNLDVMISGNDYGSEVSVGRYDAFYGLVLKGNGKGNFQPLTLAQSGYSTSGNAKGLVRLAAPGNRWLTVTSQNRDSLRFHQSISEVRQVALLPNETTVTLQLKNGKSRRKKLATAHRSYLSPRTRCSCQDICGGP
ncbi:VCBS repeat-containing protein [Paucibacter sp. O1-1]|nr:VCBS repeat-containing protein [Paucibacter sp. O1-1]MDA3831687.1 VCBS repeat-containing protein [Paucibacter sp. O1-1]